MQTSAGFPVRSCADNLNERLVMTIQSLSGSYVFGGERECRGNIYMQCGKKIKSTNPEHLLRTDKDTSCLGYVRTG